MPVNPQRPEGPPTAGEPYFIDCIINQPGINTSEIVWIGPDNMAITATTGRVRVEDVLQSGRTVKRLTFDPLSTEDSGSYRCISPSGTRIQTVTVQGKLIPTSSL